jgi:hypothetical protein
LPSLIVNASAARSSPIRRSQGPIQLSIAFGSSLIDS